INDEASGAYEAIKYLIDLGHKDILFIRGDESYSYDIKEDVYKEVLTENGLSKNIRCVNIGGGNSDKTVERTMQVMCSKLKENRIPTAIFACNDLMALGAVNACKKLNLDVPKDISIIGFDNTYISNIVEPKLTTVDQDMYGLGENASNKLMDIIENDNKKISKIKFKTKLIVRDSCSKI
ncbi:MAG: substrate-binding domain-containing protein, partial [Clostridium sp.]|nr:substrate-binding domain-containing protein [Clostridium sp.]